MENVEQTIISQYANSPTLVQMVRNIDECIDPGSDIDALYDYIWNVETAQGFGLDIWGRIVGVSRYLKITTGDVYFDFYESGASAHSFDEYPFYPEVEPASTTYRLEDSAYRKLIYAKALSNISSCTAPAINQLLNNFFAGRGVCYVADLGGMSIRYVFEFELTEPEYAIIEQAHVFPRPAGVEASFMGPDLVVHGFA